MSPHQKKQIEKELKTARKAGFEVKEVHNGHVWGYVICCTCGGRETVNCTPRSADDAAKRIARFVRSHKH
ncbi:hypothetical protein HUT18_19415 [Streptomyces sp. NA04227]|uniref:hypothetical protein n=1 Tax=Streptomyces sp. NA04227 TaxID=2742136 RepID=UPI0015902869|nr:hypothetical protein [Streptomyces sp. NA04227]QKW08225.1 hypothetical protein HUT18_19415 [Streptomyces sp. NA04227]